MIAIVYIIIQGNSFQRLVKFMTYNLSVTATFKLWKPYCLKIQIHKN